MTGIITEGIIKEGLNIAERVLPDKNAQLNAQVQSDQNQANIDLAETTKESWFFSAWRPLCGYICVFAFALHYILFPLVQSAFPNWLPPEFDMATLNTLLFNMLGISTLRTVEKVMKK